MTGIVFDIIIDNTLSDITSVAQLKGLIRKRVLSLVNDFEDASWRYPKFKNFLWDNIALTALSERERASLVNKNHSSLVAAAKNLRLTDKDEKGQGSEIAEVLLYGIMRHRYNALPVVPKIFYKQNVQDNAKGADSVHIVLNGEDFTLWFGEAKFYNSIEDSRLDSIVTSVIKSLSTDKLKKENAIITSITDLDWLEIDPILRDNIKSALSNRESIDNLKPKIHIPILLLHECGVTAAATDMTNAYRDEIIAYHKDRADAYFAKQLKKSKIVHRYEEINFHIILFPIPNKKQIVDAFVKTVAFYKGEE